MIKINKLIEIDKKLKTKMLLQIHDELIFECLEQDKEIVKKTIKEAMISVSSSEYHMFSVPLEVNVKEIIVYLFSRSGYLEPNKGKLNLGSTGKSNFDSSTSQVKEEIEIE